jgi:hypothetical protein
MLESNWRKSEWMTHYFGRGCISYCQTASQYSTDSFVLNFQIQNTVALRQLTRLTKKVLWTRGHPVRFF